MWEKVKFTDVVKDITGGNKKLSHDKYLKKGKYPIIDQGEKFIGGYFEDNLTLKVTKPVVIFGDHSRCLKYIDFDFILGADGVKVLEPFHNLNSKYLFYFLKTIKLPNVGYSRHFKFLKESIIPLPPLHIQEKIAEILDKADELRRKDKDLQSKYDELAQAIFIDMFGDPVRNEKGWQVKPFSYFVTFDTIMTSDFEKYAEVPLIGVGNIERDSGRLINYELVKDENIKSGKYIFTSDHIIYSKIRPNLNKVALPTFGGLCSADSYPLLPTQNSNKYFFSHLLRSEHFLDFISSFSNRANIPKVNKEQLKKYFGIAPSIAIQEEFAKKIEIINQLKAQNNAEKSEELFQSLLQKAFKGELVS